MFSLEPQRTQYDMNFDVLGFPVRIHPFFWLFALISGLGGNTTYTLIWIFVLFFSVLLHELGHALVIRHFGGRAHIVLYAMGGLAIEGSNDPFAFDYGRRPRTPFEQIVISAAGPGAQFLLAAIVAGALYASGGSLDTAELGSGVRIPFMYPVMPEGGNENLRYLVQSLMFFNVLWAAVNLLPVFPLDGGQIAQQLLAVQDPWNGTVKALWLSVWTGGIMAVVGLIVFREMFMLLLFASLAYGSFMMLKQLTGGGGGRPW